LASFFEGGTIYLDEDQAALVCLMYHYVM
jgi:hypothetical protein